MKILQANAGALTNFEVLDFLKSRGASNDPTRVIVPIAKSEFEVYDYLIQKPASVQTRENINEFLTRCQEYDLAKAEKLNIIDIRPSSVVEINPIIEEWENRMEDEEKVQRLVDMISEVLPPVPNSEMTPEDKEMQEAQVVEAN